MSHRCALLAALLLPALACGGSQAAPEAPPPPLADDRTGAAEPGDVVTTMVASPEKGLDLVRPSERSLLVAFNLRQLVAMQRMIESADAAGELPDHMTKLAAANREALGSIDGMVPGLVVKAEGDFATAEAYVALAEAITPARAAHVFARLQDYNARLRDEGLTQPVTAKIARVEVKGDRATVYAQGGEGDPEEAILVVREDGRWYLDVHALIEADVRAEQAHKDADG